MKRLGRAPPERKSRRAPTRSHCGGKPDAWLTTARLPPLSNSGQAVPAVSSSDDRPTSHDAVSGVSWGSDACEMEFTSKGAFQPVLGTPKVWNYRFRPGKRPSVAVRTQIGPIYGRPGAA